MILQTLSQRSGKFSCWKMVTKNSDRDVEGKQLHPRVSTWSSSVYFGFSRLTQIRRRFDNRSFAVLMSLDFFALSAFWLRTCHVDFLFNVLRDTLVVSGFTVSCSSGLAWIRARSFLLLFVAISFFEFFLLLKNWLRIQLLKLFFSILCGAYWKDCVKAGNVDVIRS